MWVRRALVLALALQVVANPRPAAAQQARVSPFVPRGHWSVEAARRLHGLGVMPAGYDPDPGSQSLLELADAFRAAATASSLAALYEDRLEREFGALSRAETGTAQRSRLGVGYRLERGAVLPGWGYENDAGWTGPVPATEASAPVLHLRHAGRSAHGAWGFDAGIGPRQPEVREAYLAGALGAAGVWIGLREQSFEVAPATGVVLERMPPRPAVGLALVRPVRMPWILAAAGPVRFTTTVARGRRNATLSRPWIWTARLMVEPHARLQVGVNRGVMFGGAGNDDLSLRNLAYLLIGKHAGGFDNQVVALTARYRPPVPGVPVVAYLEWGLEDSAGAWRDVPGLVAGVETPALPGFPSAAVGLSGSYFARSCCGNPIWYRNWMFRGGWADDGEPFGHSLGGHGNELRAYGRLDGSAWLSGAAFMRQRGSENVYAPAREGRSMGGELRAGWLPLPGWEAGVHAVVESATNASWREMLFSASIRALF